MRKLLVMLAISAAISNATPVLELSVNGVTNGAGVNQAITLPPSGTVMIDIQCTADPFWANWNLGTVGPGSIAGVGTLYVPPSPVGSVYDYEESYDTPSYVEFLGFRTSPVTNPAAAGKWWDAQFQYNGPGMATIWLIDPAFNVLDSITVTQIPEPMTVALLALGAGFLRRRRK